MKKVWVYDIEIFENFHSNTFVNRDDEDEVKQFVICSSRNDIKEYLTFLQTEVAGLIGFNSIGYDYPVLHYLLMNQELFINETAVFITRKLYEESKGVIEAQYPAIRSGKVIIPQLDLYKMWHFDNKNKRTSLKYIEINTRFENVEDLPFDEHHWVREEDIDEILRYNLNDVLATLHFYKLSVSDVEMRKMLKDEFKFSDDFLNYNDPKIGEQIFCKEISKTLGISFWELKKMRTYRNSIALRDVILPHVRFHSREFKALLDKLNTTVVVDTQKPFEYNVVYKGFKYDYGVGGVHGCIEPGVYNADENTIIYDIDIDGMYPKTGILFGFFPKHLTEKFCELYEELYEKRMKAKKQCKIDKSDVSAKAINSGLKLALNGVYGKSNDEYSPLYDPKYTMRITVNGQLLLSMLAERIADIQDLIMLQANTDGITVKIPKNKEEEFLRICKEWEEEIGYTLEYAKYKKMIIRDVNNYLAQYEDGGLKHKGIFEIIPMQNGKIAYHKNWSNRIVPIALQEYYINGTPIEQTITQHEDIYDFCIASKFPRPWVGEYTTLKTVNGETQKNKTVFKKNLRHYISNKGSYLWKVNTDDGRRNQINKGFQAIPFNKYERKDNYDINYNYYISETRKIILTINDGQIKMPWF